MKEKPYGNSVNVNSFKGKGNSAKQGQRNRDPNVNPIITTSIWGERIPGKCHANGYETLSSERAPFSQTPATCFQTKTPSSEETQTTHIFIRI